MLNISLLGAPRAELDGVAIEVDTRKAVALLAYLAVTGRPHTRDALCNLLWPEYDQEHARGALRRTLSTLRKALGPEWLDTGRELVALRRDDGMAVELDVEQFRASLAAGDPASLTEAVELYRGDFLAGFTLRDSVNFDDWQYFEADSLRRELAEALELLVDAHAARDEHDRGILLARRWLALNPLHEPAHRRLIELYTLNGERDAALRQYRECVRVLDAELGVTPVEETNELYRAVQENRLQVARPAVRKAAVSDATPVEVAVPHALVGREAEWKALVSAYESIGKDGRLVVLEGEPGIGKTRLAEELVSHVSAQRGTVIATRAYEEERELAYAPVAEAVRAALSMVESPPEGALAEAARLLPDVGPASSLPLDSPGAQTRFLESLALLVQAPLAGPRPGLLLLDDVHWADEATHDFLTYVIRRLAGQPMLVLLTWRPEEVPPGHRLRRMAAETGLVIALERLTRENVDELARSLAPAAGEAQIYEETEGVPLLVVEYCRALARGEEKLPGGVRDLLRGRLESVSEVAAQVLAAAAVIGRPFDTDILREASGRTDEETVGALEELEARGLIGETGDAYDFRHDQLRVLAQEETSLARRRLLHRRVAEFLARRPASSGPLAGSVARHYQLAGREEEAAQFFRLAGDHASSLYANVDALAHFRAALALGHPDTAELHQAIGDLETLRGKYETALASYEAAAAATRPEAVAAVEHKLGALHLRRGAWDLAVSHLRAALAGAGEDTALAARVAADLSLALHRAGDPKAAAELAEQALDRAESAGERRALAQAHNILGLLAASGSRPEAARPHLEESLTLTSGPGDADARAAALNNLALTLRAEGEVERALELTEEALRLCQAQGDRHREAALHNNLADLLRAAGRPDDAMTHLKQAVAIFADVGEDAVSQPEIWKLVRW